MNQKLKKYKKTRIMLSVLLVILLLIGTSFAVFQNFARQTTTNDISSLNCFTVSFEGVTSAINLENDYPITDEEGLTRSPYTFKVTNTCNQYLSLSIGVETLSTSEIPSNLIKGVIIRNGKTPTSAMLLSNGKTMEAQNGGKAYELLTDSLSANSSKTYDLRLWFDESMTKEQGASKKYQGKVIIGSTADIGPMPAPNGWYDAENDMLLAALKNDNTLKSTLTIPGKEVSAHTKDDIVVTSTESVSNKYQSYYFTYGTGYEANGTKFNLTGATVTSDTYANSYSSLVGKYLPSTTLWLASSSTAGTMKTTTDLDAVYYVVSATSSGFVYKKITSNKNVLEAELASTIDDYGTSYYFRGAVKNNYVEFANKCWRIVRITGDGSIKLVLHNDNISNITYPCSSVNNNGKAAYAHSDEYIITSMFNPNFNDNTYIGFMYGAAGASDYASTHANTNKSTLLTNLETWYTNNLASYESKLADTIWCNDKSTVSEGLGYGTNETIYSTTSRLGDGSASLDANPSLICPNDNNGGNLSKYTVNDIINGNGALTYKIGILSVDEIIFAGYKEYCENPVTYLKENATDEEWWTLSPVDYGYSGSYDKANIAVVVRDTFDYNYVGEWDGDYAFRPAISLKSSTTISGGSGTSEDPYVVK